MKQVNLRELYPDAYVDDEYVDVSNEVYETLCEFERKDEAFDRRKHRNKAIYSLDAGDGIENDALLPPQTPEEIIIARETHEELLSQIASLPDKQARRVYAHFFLNMESSEIAQRENVEKSCVNKSIKRGLKELTKCSNIFSD